MHFWLGTLKRFCIRDCYQCAKFHVCTTLLYVHENHFSFSFSLQKLNSATLYVFMVMQIKLVVSATNYDIKNLLFFSGTQTCLLPAGYYPLEFTCICGDTLVCLQATSN